MCCTGTSPFPRFFTFRPLVQSLLEQDTYMLLADFQSYAECQERGNARGCGPSNDWGEGRARVRAHKTTQQQVEREAEGVGRSRREDERERG